MRSTLLIAVFFVAGCGGPEVSKVTGTILVEGEPPTRRTQVCFWPKDDLSLGIIKAFRLDADGGFDIAPNPARGEGRAGLYKVIVAQPMKQDKHGLPTTAPGPAISKRYANLEKTPLEVSISPGINDIGVMDLASDKNDRRN